MEIYYVTIHDMSTGYCEQCETEEKARKVFNEYLSSARHTCDVVDAIKEVIHSDGTRTEHKLFW